MNVAVIGSGVSGLFSAYRLCKEGHTVTVFEKESQIGGNAQTVQVQIGDTVRWADLGVNDFNKVSYTKLVKYLDELDVPYKPLQDTEAFSTLDGTTCYTLDGQWGTTFPPNIQQEYTRFSDNAPNDVNNPKYHDYSVSAYLAEKGYSPEFGRCNLYPRINGMYFAQDTTPDTMPFIGIMHYYILQEGFGSGPPQRQYFADGAGSWLAALAKAVRDAGGKIETDMSVRLSASDGGVEVATAGGTEHYDCCVVSCHAASALKMFDDGLTPEMVKVLSAFDYMDSVSIVHTYAPLLPPDKSAWRTYNILVHDNFAQLRPYTISYVVNLHQNDPENPLYNNFETPYYFVTLNPALPIPDRYVLRTTTGERALGYFPHNVVNLEAIAAQQHVACLQGHHCLYYCGGWTTGAGLQEECLESVEFMLEKMKDPDAPATHLYDLTPGAERHAPDYIRDALKKS